MSTIKKHSEIILEQFGENTTLYKNSLLHSKNKDLEVITDCLVDKKEAVLVDLGAGSGHTSIACAPLVKWVISVDPSDDMLSTIISQAKSNNVTNIVTRKSFSESLPFSDGSVDIVVSRFSTHHWLDVRKSFMEISRVLKPGGLLIISDTVSPNAFLLDTWINSIELLRDRSHIRNYTLSQYNEFMQNNGLNVTDISNLSLNIDFDSWVERSGCKAEKLLMLRELMSSAPLEVREYYDIADNFSFTLDNAVLIATKS